MILLCFAGSTSVKPSQGAHLRREDYYYSSLTSPTTTPPPHVAADYPILLVVDDTPQDITLLGFFQALSFRVSHVVLCFCFVCLFVNFARRRRYSLLAPPHASERYNALHIHTIPHVFFSSGQSLVGYIQGVSSTPSLTHVSIATHTAPSFPRTSLRVM